MRIKELLVQRKIYYFVRVTIQFYFREYIQFKLIIKMQYVIKLFIINYNNYLDHHNVIKIIFYLAIILNDDDSNDLK